MRAAWYEATGAAADVLRVGELPTPEPRPGEVRVRLHASGVNPSDVKSRAGRRAAAMPFPRVVPHSDGAGVVDAVGAGVPASRLGERVWVWNAAWGRPDGTAAEYVALPSPQAVALPDGVSFGAGACLGIPALTALHAVRCEGGVAGQTVLVAGGSGAVGHYAVQCARLLGAARVIATVSSAAKAALARAAGADATIDYRRDDVAAAVRALTGGRGVDRIVEVDVAANAALDVELLRPGGRVVVYGSGAADVKLTFFALIAKAVSLHFFIVYHLSDADRGHAEGALARFLADGRLVHNVAEQLPLERIVEAHERVESGRLAGNLVLTID